MDEQVANFCAVTSAETDVAKQYLQVCDNDIERAIGMYFENGGAPIGGTATTGAAAVNDDDAPVIPPEEDDVREADAPITERLVGPQDTGMFTGLPGGGMMGGFGGMLGVGGMMAPNRNVGIFNQRAPRVRGAFEDSDREDEDGGGGSDDGMAERVGSSNLTAHQSRLANLFRPPFDLIREVGFDEAKEVAIREQKWIMVNIQDGQDFQCQQLNRDLWSDKRIKDCVKNNFVFLQCDHESPMGQEYKNMYQYESLPHIAILDSKTGEQLKTWDKVPDVTGFLEELYDFLSQFSLKSGHKNPVVEKPKQPKKVEHMSEEEQIEMAMRQSMGLSANTGTAEDPVELDDSDEEMGEYPKPSTSSVAYNPEPVQEPEVEEEEHRVETDEDKFVLIEACEDAEPANDPKTTTRIQFRYSGGRVIRRFALNDPVTKVFGVVKAIVPEVKGQYFSLTTPERKKLIEHLDETVESCNLKNSVVMIEID